MKEINSGFYAKNLFLKFVLYVKKEKKSDIECFEKQKLALPVGKNIFLFSVIRL